MANEKNQPNAEKLTKRGRPRCQRIEHGIQCGKTIYADGLCWAHYRENAEEEVDADDLSLEQWAREIAND